MVEAARSLEEFYTAMEGWSELVVRENPLLVCQQGCARCCKTQVMVGEPEWAPIHAWMRANMTKAQRQTVVRRVHTQLNTPGNPLKRWLGMRDKHPRALTNAIKIGFHAEATRCPFLGDDNRCEIYPVRPFVCRAYGRAETTQGAPMLCDVFIGRYRQDPEASKDRKMESMALMVPKYFELNAAPGGGDGLFTMAAAHVLRNSTADGDLLKNPVPLAAETVYPVTTPEHFARTTKPRPARMKARSADADDSEASHADGTESRLPQR